MKNDLKERGESEGSAAPRVANARTHYRRDVLQIVLFAVALLLPSIGFLAGINDFDLMAENRRPAERPDAPETFADWQAFPEKFEGYFDDHFGFRSYLLGRDKRLEWLGRRTDVEIQVGREGWLFQGTRAVSTAILLVPKRR